MDCLYTFTYEIRQLAAVAQTPPPCRVNPPGPAHPQRRPLYHPRRDTAEIKGIPGDETQSARAAETAAMLPL